MTVLVVGLAATVAACMSLGIFSNWGYAIIAAVAYIIIGLIVNKITKHFASKYLKQGHLMLGLLCRSENNRLFLKCNIEMRPGFQGKWIEFTRHDKELTPE
jgi:energy-coupling factor transporter transmembrane protein EcfT